MKLNVESVKKVAKLANLPIEESELEIYAEQLSKVLDYIKKIDEIDTSKISPLFNPSGRSQITRAGDKPKNWLTQDEALANGAKTRDGYFITKGVFDDE